jgi:hypothetical protein
MAKSRSAKAVTKSNEPAQPTVLVEAQRLVDQIPKMSKLAAPCTRPGQLPGAQWVGRENGTNPSTSPD